MSPARIVASIAVLTAALWAAVPSFAASEEQQAKPGSTPVKLITLDLAVPDSPAFAILGLSPETVVRPSSPRDLATTLLNGVDRRGNLQSGPRARRRSTLSLRRPDAHPRRLQGVEGNAGLRTYTGLTRHGKRHQRIRQGDACRVRAEDNALGCRRSTPR